MESHRFLSSVSSLETTAITTRKSSWVNVAKTQCHPRPKASPDFLPITATRSLAPQPAILLLLVLIALVTGGISVISAATTDDGNASCLLSVAISFGWVIAVLLRWYWQEAPGGLYMGTLPLFLALLASVALVLKFGSASRSTIVLPWLPLIICYATLQWRCKRGDEYHRQWGWPCHREEDLREGELDLMV